MKINFRKLSMLMASIALTVSCSGGSKENPWNPDWDKPGQETPGKDDTDNPGKEDEDIEIVGKPRYVWIDAAANFPDYENNREKVFSDVQRMKDTGFTDIIVDVRPTSGDVLFKSTVADPLKKVDVWTSSGYKWVNRTGTYDYLQTFIDAARKAGMRVNASMNTFVGGYLCAYGLGSDGLLFRDGSKKGWASVINASGGLKSTMDVTEYGTRFLNPANDEAQAYVLQIIKDLAQYDLDGIVLDRCRYDDNDLMSDFSKESRTKFETYVGRTISNWPSDILAPGTSDFSSRSVPETTKLWLEFKAKTIHDFIVKAAAAVHGINSKIRFGVYVGAWYSEYYKCGVNWASPKYDPKAAGYFWASANYKNYGYADHCDFMFLGAYAGTDSIYGTTEWTMQGFCQKGKALLRGDTVFSGGPDIGNSTGWTEGGQGDKIPDAVKACINNSDGFFVFDLCHIKKFDYWDAFKKSFDEYLSTVK